MTSARTDSSQEPTFLYQGRRFLWGYSADRQACGMWEVGDPAGPPHRSWPIAEHDAAWQAYRSTEPFAETYSDREPGSFASPSPSAQSTEIAGNGASARSPAAAVETATAPKEVSAQESPATVEASRGRSEPASPVPSPPATEGRFLDDLSPSYDFSSTPSNKSSRFGSVPRWRLIALGAALVAVVVAGAVVAVSKLHSSSAPADPQQAILTAAKATEGLQTAHMSMTERVGGVAGTGTVTVPANGVVNFSTGDADLHMTIEGQPTSVVTTGGVVYVSLPTIPQILPGKTWLSVDLGSIGSAAGGALTGGDPAQMLQLLAAEGNLVTPLGSSTVGGTSVEGYSVLINKAAVETQLAKLGLPAAAVQAGEQFLKQAGPISYKVYVDSSNQMREMDFLMSVPSGSHSVTVAASVDFSDFGTPVDVKAPAASAVANLQQFLQAASGASGSQ